MENTINQLEQILGDYSPRLRRISQAEFSAKPNPQKWSRKEELGHLVDSAQTNIRRFIVAQYEEKPFIKYNQDIWVSASGYHDYDTIDLLDLWVLLNRHICMVLKKMSPEAAERLCDTGELHTIAWLAHDYNKHLLHHLHKILDLGEISYP